MMRDPPVGDGAAPGDHDAERAESGVRGVPGGHSGIPVSPSNVRGDGHTCRVALVSEDEVFQAVQDLVAAGEYLDQIPGVPMPSAYGGGGAFQRTSDGGYRRIYHRGSREYLQARADGLAEPLPGALVPAPEEAVGEAERVIGLPFPPLLRRLYLEVGNGGFGPGYGLLELSYDSPYTGLSMYRQAREDATRNWAAFPPSLFPVCTWGCGIYSFTDCSSPEGRMWGWDPNPGPCDAQALYPQPLGLAGWLARWIDNRLYQPWLIEDPISGTWRGATDDDYAEMLAELE